MYDMAKIIFIEKYSLAAKMPYKMMLPIKFDGQNKNKYENIPSLCDKFKVKKNLINPVYLS